jgi:hypothetical protein
MKKRHIWKPRAKRSIWVSKNPKRTKPKRSIWATRQPKKAGIPISQYNTRYQVYLLSGNKARRVKVFRDEREAQSWVEDARVKTPYNNYKISPLDKKRGFF